MSLGPRVRIVYHMQGAKTRREALVLGNGCVTGGSILRELGIAVSGNDQVRRVSVTPDLPVVIDEIVATMEIAIDQADAIYLNGYNSWTDSIERPVDDLMWGLKRVPKPVVEAFVLDASGDYRFVREDVRRGHQHGFGYGYLRQGDEVLLFGSLNEDTGFTVIHEDLDAGVLRFCKEPPSRVLVPHETCEIISLAITGGRLEDAVREWLGLCGIKCCPSQPVAGYSSWYRHYGAIDAWKLEHDLNATAQMMGGLDLGGVDPVFQIDDGYAKVGDWLEYDCARFPRSLADLADKARAAGLTPGLWLAPFVCERDSRTYQEHPDWLLRDSKGQPVASGSQWSGGYALDVLNPEVRDYVGEVLRTVTHGWGFALLKLDFLYAACLEARGNKNRGEIMADALELLRASVEPGTRLLFCGVPLTSAFGRCEYCRIGQDVGLDWDDLPHRRILHRERVSTRLSLANARGRAHLDGLAFRCDPDILFLREDGVSFSPEQYEEMFETDVSSGGVLFTSDDMSTWNAGQIDRWHEAIRRFRVHNGV